MEKITIEMLNGVCREQKRLFKKTFGESAKITKENFDKATLAGLNVPWLERYMDFPIRAAYRKLVDRNFHECSNKLRIEINKSADKDRTVMVQRKPTTRDVDSLKPLFQIFSRYENILNRALLKGLLASNELVARRRKRAKGR